MTHFTLSSYERALRLPTSFPISGLARLGVKPRLCRSSWRAFASTHPLISPSTSPREALLACPPFPLRVCLRSQWSPHFRLHALVLIPLSLAHLDSLPPHDLVLWTDCSVPSPLGKGGSGVLANCSLSICGTEAIFFFSAGPVCSSFAAETCAILLVSAAPTSLPFLFSYLTLVLSSPSSFLLSDTLWQIWQKLSSLLFLSDYNGSPDTPFFRRTTRLISWPDGERYLRPLQFLVVSLGLEANCLI